MKSLAAVALFVLGLSVSARANDSAVSGEGGSWQPLHGEHRDVRMESERVQIEVGEGSYITQADFMFENSGRAQMVPMGFPESGGGDAFDAAHGFQSFASWVDGEQVSTRRKRVDSGGEGYKALWLKKVWFERGQKRRVRVVYRSRVGSFSNSGNYFVSYNFTGGNWRGDVAESILTVHFNAPGRYWYRAPRADSEGKRENRPIFHRAGTRLKYVWRHWQAQNAWMMDYVVAAPNAFALASKYDQPRDPDDPQSFTISGAIRDSSFGWFQRTDCIKRNGSMFIDLGSLQRLLSERWKLNNSSQPEPQLWGEEQGHWVGLGTARYHWMWRFGWPYVAFRDRKAKVTRTVRLRAAPFKQRWHYYVPLQSIIDTLGGLAKINRSTRAVSLAIPPLQRI